MQDKKKRLIIGVIIGAVLLAAAVGIFFIVRGSSSSSENEDAVFVSSLSEINGGFAGNMVFSGVIEPQKTLNVQKDDTKKVAEIFVKVGQEVKTGDPLFSYDVDDLTIQQQQTQLELDNLDARISTLNSQIDALTKEKANASSEDQLSYSLQIQALQLDVKTAEYDKASKAQSLEKIEEMLKNTVVKSEMDGIIKSIADDNSSDYDYYGGQENTGFITILSTGQYRVNATASELNINQLWEGMRVTIQSRVDPTAFWGGTIETISREPSQDGNQNSMFGEPTTSGASKYSFYSILDDYEGLILGQHVYVHLGDAPTDESELVIPSYYVFEEDEKTYVWAANNNHLEKHEVSLGELDEETGTYVVLSGLDESSLIAFPTGEDMDGKPCTQEVIDPIEDPSLGG